MKGPFIATVDIGAPFKVQSEPYTIAASIVKPDITPKRKIWLTVVVLAVVIALVIIQVFRTKRT
ncbi:MAG: hypothetical protein GY774_28715 [Planctomycetes bacterium]|nr:hypothetical protein [Planctomycetota bacterium]